MRSSEPNDSSTFLVNLDGVIASEAKLPSYIIRTAKDLKYSSFLTTGAFFDKLSKDELQHLAGLSETVFQQMRESSDEDPADNHGDSPAAILSLLACLLLTGEGATDFDTEDVNKAVKHLMLLSAIEFARSKGAKVKLFRNRYSVSQDKGIVAQRIE